MGQKSPISNSDREKIVQLIMMGISPSEIAEKFKCKLEAVDHIKQLLKKDGVDLPDLRKTNRKPLIQPGSAPATYEALIGKGPKKIPNSLEEGKLLKISVNNIPIKITENPLLVELDDKGLKITYANHEVTISFESFTKP